MLKENVTQSPQQTNSAKKEATPAAGTVAYTLFLYREQLRRRNVRWLALSKTKLDLTQELVSCSVERIAEYDVDELMNLNREISFTRQLKSRMHQMKRMQKLYAMQRNVVTKM